jgi:uncharacterized membrane protein YebE (DUF533 family)
MHGSGDMVYVAGGALALGLAGYGVYSAYKAMQRNNERHSGSALPQ